MISGIKIYDSNGILKKEISKQEAIALYDEKNEKNWSLSPSERKNFMGDLFSGPSLNGVSF